MFESKVIKLTDFRDMEITEEMQGKALSEEEIKDILNKLAKKNVVTAEVDSIEKGDFVILDLKGEETKFNKNGLQINVGLGLFNKELEDEILGMEKNENKTLTINDKEVKVGVKSIKRRSIPEVTDELIAGLHIEGVNTIGEYKEYLRDKDIKEKRMNIIPFKSFEYIVENSEYNILDEDLKSLYDEEVRSLEAQASFYNKTLEEFVKEVYEISTEGILKWLEDTTPEKLNQILVGMEFAREDDKMLTQEIYDEEIKTSAQEGNVSFDKAKEMHSHMLFQGSWYPLKAMERIHEYWKEEIYK